MIVKDVYCECDVGWASIIEGAIQELSECGAKATGFKEKNGKLDIYTEPFVNKTEAEVQNILQIIDRYWEISASICERCGLPGESHYFGYKKTLCKRCYEDILQL